MIRILIAFFCFNTFSAFAALNIQDGNIQENFSETVKVSGKFLMGIQYSGKHDFDSLYVDLPPNSKGMLCIKMSSIDGVYKATLRHLIAENTSGRTKVIFESKYKDEISDLKINELALLASIGESCSLNNAKFLMSSWSKDTSNLSPILIIRSGARLDVAHIPSIENSKKSTKCKKFKGPKTITFDKYCELDTKSLTRLKSVEVFRKKMREMPSKKIFISI